MEEHVETYAPTFSSVSKGAGFVSGAQAKTVLTSSGLSTGSLRKIWELSDMDKDGQLDLNEFVVAMYLSDCVKAGEAVPKELDPSMIPPDKR